MKRGRARGSAGFHNNKMYVVGGYNSDYMSFVEVFDPDHETWKDGPSLQRPRADGAVFSCNGELFGIISYIFEHIFYIDIIQCSEDSMETIMRRRSKN